MLFDGNLIEFEILAQALEIERSADRERFLEQKCAHLPQLRSRIHQLLARANETARFMDESVDRIDTSDNLVIRATGTCGRPTSTAQHDLNKEDSYAVGRERQIGPYKLLQKLGEGGMGVVFLAEQKEPVKRRVALKIIKEGMDSKAVLARFEAERHALSLMDHPNIARVLDAGTTTSSKPYFVMELVKGTPIHQYCDQRQLNTRERLDLFKPICCAVQHAHLKGIVHRDLKPSNILVAEYDDKAVPKVIDFGIAKALYQSLTEKTLFTNIGQVIGTVEYMSPEQAKVNELDVDTRSDIYSLGVLLYELLTGSTPIDRTRLRRAAWDEVLSIIRDEQPPRPSKRISTSSALPAIALSRRTTPSRLELSVRGDLDWIVMKALEKDRNRRYQTCTSFAEDIDRFINNEPVVACPPSNLYVLSKFVRRNAMPVACLILIIASLVTGMATTTWYMIKAQEAQNRAVSARALTLGQVSHTRYNFEQSRRLMIQRDAADRLSILANRAIATRVTWAYENSLITASLRDDLLNTLLRCWNERLAEAESLANSDGKASENGSENSELLSFKHRVTLIALQSSELQARMGHHKAAVQRLEGIIADTPLDQTLFLESARIYSICASCVPPTEIELRASYLHSGKSCILPMLDDAVQQIQAWKQLEERGLANHTIMPDLAWLEVVADDPDFRPLNIHEEATHWHSQWIAHQDKHKPNRFEAESDTKSSMTIQKSNSF